MSTNKSQVMMIAQRVEIMSGKGVFNSNISTVDVFQCNEVKA